jgi:hypothetical protein
VTTAGTPSSTAYSPIRNALPGAETAAGRSRPGTGLVHGSSSTEASGPGPTASTASTPGSAARRAVEGRGDVGAAQDLDVRAGVAGDVALEAVAARLPDVVQDGQGGAVPVEQRRHGGEHAGVHLEGAVLHRGAEGGEVAGGERLARRRRGRPRRCRPTRGSRARCRRCAASRRSIRPAFCRGRCARSRGAGPSDPRGAAGARSSRGRRLARRAPGGRTRPTASARRTRSRGGRGSTARRDRWCSRPNAPAAAIVSAANPEADDARPAAVGRWLVDDDGARRAGSPRIACHTRSRWRATFIAAFSSGAPASAADRPETSVNESRSAGRSTSRCAGDRGSATASRRRGGSDPGSTTGASPST